MLEDIFIFWEVREGVRKTTVCEFLETPFAQLLQTFYKKVSFFWAVYQGSWFWTVFGDLKALQHVKKNIDNMDGDNKIGEII